MLEYVTMPVTLCVQRLKFIAQHGGQQQRATCHSLRAPTAAVAHVTELSYFVQRLDNVEKRSARGGGSSATMAEYMSTHPATEGRVAEARKRAAAAAPLAELSDCERYRGGLRWGFTMSSGGGFDGGGEGRPGGPEVGVVNDQELRGM